MEKLKNSVLIIGMTISLFLYMLILLMLLPIDIFVIMLSVKNKSLKFTEKIFHRLPDFKSDEL